MKKHCPPSPLPLFFFLFVCFFVIFYRKNYLSKVICLSKRRFLLQKSIHALFLFLSLSKFFLSVRPKRTNDVKTRKKNDDKIKSLFQNFLFDFFVFSIIWSAVFFFSFFPPVSRQRKSKKMKRRRRRDSEEERGGGGMSKVLYLFFWMILCGSGFFCSIFWFFIFRRTFF